MLGALTILLVFQLTGEVLTQLFALPIPGPVIGMALLFAPAGVGIASHGIGTARAFQVSEQAGAFSGLAMGLNALLTALLVPLLIPFLKNWF